MALDIKKAANFFLSKVDSDDEITHLKLQKLCYYAQAWYLAINHEPLFKDEFEAWAHGPVNRTLWDEYKMFSWSPIPSPVEYNDSEYTEKQKDHLDDIWDVYGKYTAKYLENLTHEEDPWKEARGNCEEGETCSTPIKNEAMENFYFGLLVEDNG